MRRSVDQACQVDGDVDVDVGQSGGVDRSLGRHQRGDGLGHDPDVDVHPGYGNARIEPEDDRFRVAGSPR